jgi:GNAT superfamily N-acetyltransferase
VKIPFVIEEITNPDSARLPGMIHWMSQLFPEYTPYFKTILTELRHEDGRHEAQLFVGLSEDQVIGLIQIFYRQWRNGLLADIDLLGVLGPYRRSGLGSALVRQAFMATRNVASHYGLPTLGIVSLADPKYIPVVRLHQKLGGQIRTDLQYPSGDIIVWYPLHDQFTAVSTKALAWQLWQFGGLPEGGFIRQYGANPDSTL